VRGQLAAALLATVIAACGPSQVSPSPSPEDIGPTAVVTLGPSETPLPTSGVVIDSRLLDVLPVSVDGLPITENTAGEAASLGDPLLDQVAAAFASGFASDAAATEFVYAVVVRLQPDVMDATVYRDWRDSYDEGACSQADGVARHAETVIDGRTVYIGTCVGGLRTYHVWLEETDVLVSASAVGERRLGELLVENLRP
jgi:hypothetical protein